MAQRASKLKKKRCRCLIQYLANHNLILLSDNLWTRSRKLTHIFNQMTKIISNQSSTDHYYNYMSLDLIQYQNPVPVGGWKLFLLVLQPHVSQIPELPLPENYINPPVTVHFKSKVGTILKTLCLSLKTVKTICCHRII